MRHHIEHRFEDPGIVEVQVWLMRVEAMPIESISLIVPGPVRLFRVEKNDRGVLVGAIRVRPNIEIARNRARLGRAGALKPGMLIRGMIDYEFGDYPQFQPLHLDRESFQIAQASIGGVYSTIG